MELRQMAYLDQTFGVEFEVYLPVGLSHGAAAMALTNQGIDCRPESYNHQTRTWWKIVTDGSLNDYARGAEFVSPVLQGEAGLETVATVLALLNDMGCTVSKLCGTHVHVGVGHGNGNIAFFRNLLKLYAHFEPVIDRFMAASRRASAASYCRSVTNVPFRTIDRTDSVEGLIRALTPPGHTARYTKLNLCAYRAHQTVEFRQHQGTLDNAKVRNWILLCLKLVWAAKSGNGIATGGGAINRARLGSKGHLVGQLMLRTEGVTREEACAATGWPSISLPQRARECGLAYTTQRTGRVVRYFAQAAAASTEAPASLEGLFGKLGLDDAERAFFTARTAHLSSSMAMAA
jgi:hypothetical protein